MRSLPHAAILLALRGVGVVAGKMTEPRVFFGSDWKGIDGNWSTTTFFVGGQDASEAKLDLIISTIISETMIVGAGGCVQNEQRCPVYRGGIIDVWASPTWKSLNDWQLDSVSYLDIIANGNYGLDTVTLQDSISEGVVEIDQSVIAAVNTTEIYVGMFGLGITSSSFGGQSSLAPLSKMVADYGWFSSYTYGYTAGAYYRGAAGTGSSLVLGGYDKNRFEAHNTDFTLARDPFQPKALVRGIEVSLPPGRDLPSSWQSNTFILSRMNQSFEALIDSTTPFLWLPQDVCNNFVEAMELTWNKTLEAFVVTNDQRANLSRDDGYTFTFSLSSYDNTNNFGNPLNVAGVVNITLPGKAFSHTLTYPYHGEAIGYGEPAQPYFPIKCSEKSTFILGRTFLQEAYLLTKYDSTVFSVHQAKFPADVKDVDIQEVTQPPRSEFPPPLKVDEKSGLTKSQMIGIVSGTVVVSLIGLFIFLFCCRRRRRTRRLNKAMQAYDDSKDTDSSISDEPPKTPVARIFSKIIRRKRSRKTDAETGSSSGTNSNPAEVGADSNHAVYELPAPLEPVEMDADNESVADVDMRTTTTTTDGTGDGGSDRERYEAMKAKLQRQLAGPVPAYSPPETEAGSSGEGAEKGMQDVSPVETYRPSDNRGVSPTSSPTHTNPGTLPPALPSPMSPVHPDWHTRGPDMLPSPLTATAPRHPIFGAATSTSSNSSSIPPRINTFPSSISRSNSSNDPSPISATSSSLIVPPSPAFQRTPIDPTRIICLGPLPENVQLPSPNSATLPKLVVPATNQQPREVAVDSGGARLSLSAGGGLGTRLSTDTLGSNYTEFEEQQMALQEESRRQEAEHRLESPRSQERIVDGGNELVHVPQLAERRYSWEDTR